VCYRDTLPSHCSRRAGQRASLYAGNMSTLIEQMGTAADAGFQSRVHAAILAEAQVIAAAAVTGDVATYTLRTALAAKILGASSTSMATTFAYAIAVTSGVAADIGVPVNIIDSSAASPAVIDTQSAHGLTTGGVGKVINTIDPVLSGTWPVTVVTSTQFTIPVAGTLSGTIGGTVTPQPTDADIATAVAAVWNAVAGISAST
jgi:hypothetical protein